VQPAQFKCRITHEARELLAEAQQLIDDIARRDIPDHEKRIALSNHLRGFGWDKAVRIARRGRLSIDDLTTLSLLNCVAGGDAMAYVVSTAIAKAAGAKLRGAHAIGRDMCWRVTLPGR